MYLFYLTNPSSREQPKRQQSHPCFALQIVRPLKKPGTGEETLPPPLLPSPPPQRLHVTQAPPPNPSRPTRAKLVSLSRSPPSRRRGPEADPCGRHVAGFSQCSVCTLALTDRTVAYKSCTRHSQVYIFQHLINLRDMEGRRFRRDQQKMKIDHHASTRFKFLIRMGRGRGRELLTRFAGCYMYVRYVITLFNKVS